VCMCVLLFFSVCVRECVYVCVFLCVYMCVSFMCISVSEYLSGSSAPRFHTGPQIKSTCVCLCFCVCLCVLLCMFVCVALSFVCVCVSVCAGVCVSVLVCWRLRQHHQYQDPVLWSQQSVRVCVCFTDCIYVCMFVWVRFWSVGPSVC